MKRFLIACVTYNSYIELERYIKSIDLAAAEVKGIWSVDVCIADNTTENIQEPMLKPDSIDSLRYFSFKENLGYFGAAQKVLDQTDDLQQYDIVTISNVDLEMPRDFFLRLDNLQVESTTGWIANSILSGYENRDRNPKIVARYTEKRLKQLRLLFRFPILHQLYTKTLYRRKKINQKKQSMPIYAGHGSFIMLTKAFFKNNPHLDYPMFLFCEEIYLAELCRKSNLEVIYKPEICVRDTEHCSTGKMRKSSYYRYNYDSINYILKTFY